MSSILNVLTSLGYLFGSIIFACVVLLPLVIWHAHKHAYICKHCGYGFEISTLKDLVSPHSTNSKLLKCPSCHKWAWQRMVSKSGIGHK